MKRILTVVILATVFSTAGQAEDEVVDTTKRDVKPEVTVEQTVSANSVESKVKVEDSVQWNGLMQSYAGEELLKRLNSLPGIKNVQFIPGEHVVNEKYYSEEIVDSKRDSSAVIRIAGRTPITLMFKVEEKLRRCSSIAVSEDDELNKWGAVIFSEGNTGVEAPCRMESEVKVTGPIAVYGNIPGSFTNRMLLLNQITLDWSIKLSYDKRDTEIRSKFTADRLDFAEAVQKLITWTHGTPPFTSIFMTNPANNALVQVGRALKSKNEEILRGQ